MHNLLLVYLLISTCFGRPCARHQEKHCSYATLGTCYSVWMAVWYAGAYAPAYQNNKYQVSHKHCCFSGWCAHSRPKHVEIDKYTSNKYTKNKLCTKLALFTRCNIYIYIYMTSNCDVLKLVYFTIAGSFVCCLKSICLFSFGSDESVTDGWMKFDPFLSYCSSNILLGLKSCIKLQGNSSGSCSGHET